MDLKGLITHFTYRIEAKPGGGFVAHAADPTLPPIEAPTRWELQQKIQQNISAALAAEFPGLKLPAENQQLKVSFHIEQKPGGGFLIHTTDPNGQPTEAASHEIESKFAEKFIGFAGKHLLPQLSPELAAQLTSGDIKVFVNRKGIGSVGDLSPSNAGDLSTLNLESNTSGTSSQNASLAQTNAAATLNVAATSNAAFSYTGDNSPDSPIHRTTSNSGGLLHFLLALLIIGAIMYFWLRYH